MFRHIVRFMREEDGASAVEYGLLVALIAVVIWVSVQTLGQNLNTMFSNIATNIGTAS